MSTPQQRIETELRQALKSGDKLRLATLRLLLAEINNERIRRGGEVDDEGFWALVRRAIKQRHEASEQFRNGGRPELADQEEAEARILADYLPQQVAEAELRAAIAALIAEQGLAGPRGIGPVMKAMLARFAGRADGTEINRIARELLG